MMAIDSANMHCSTAEASWISELKSMITDPYELYKTLELPTDGIEQSLQAMQAFPLRVTHSFVARMRKGDPTDPLLRQVLPLAVEEKITPQFLKDPLDERRYNPVPGLLHKYHGRALITVSGSCAIHCRYCFRRHFPYAQNIPGKQLEQILNYLMQDASIHEVILSGGDPLVSRDSYLEQLIEKLSNIHHIQIVRIHTRLPIVLPKRITAGLIKCLTHGRLKPVVVIHTNHANEINSEVAQVLMQLVCSGITVLNQTVLLKGINDDVDSLSALSYALFNCKVLPYYLHRLDKVHGAAHFDISMKKAKNLYHALRARLPGYLVPLLVQEQPGALFKIPLV